MIHQAPDGSAAKTHDDPKEGLEYRKYGKRSSFLESASLKINHLARELSRLASITKGSNHQRFDWIVSAASWALKGLRFTGRSATGWSGMERRFDELTRDSNGLLHRSRFAEFIGMKESREFAEELFNALARRSNITGDSINKEQLRVLWDEISEQSFDARAQTFLAMVDKDGDGKITKEELKAIISLSACTNHLVGVQKEADEYATLIMEKLDLDGRGFISIDKLEMLLFRGPSRSSKALDNAHLSEVLTRKVDPTQKPNPPSRWYEGFVYFITDNWQRAWVMALWIGVMTALFVYKYVEYINTPVYNVMGVCVCIAKGSAETLKLNMALTLLPVCRKTITWLRNKTMLGVAVPFDENINFHKILAVAIAVGVAIHSFAHLACNYPRLCNASPQKYRQVEQYFGEQPRFWDLVKGVEGVTGIVMVVLMAIAFTQATPKLRNAKEEVHSQKPLDVFKGFRAFWYTHHLFIIVYSLLIVHGIELNVALEWYKKTTWMYLAIPMTLYACERLIRASWSRIKPVKLIKAAIYREALLALYMSKPEGFEYQSGQYIFVNCTDVSAFEWHPFSITSAPGDDLLSIHIKPVGDWTKHLKTIFSKLSPVTSDCVQVTNHSKFPKVLIDGPYGAPAQEYQKYEVVLLVGLGIGATPMISIVKDILNSTKATDEAREKAMAKHGSSSSRMRTRKAYFYWVTREEGSFDWFRGIMKEASGMDQNEMIELHNYCTSLYEKGDARASLIAILQSLHYAKHGVDIISGTRVKTHFAKPDWRGVFESIAHHHPDAKIGVFYCGRSGVAKQLRKLAAEFTHTTSTAFEFHKENF